MSGGTLEERARYKAEAAFATLAEDLAHQGSGKTLLNLTFVLADFARQELEQAAKIAENQLHDSSTLNHRYQIAAAIRAYAAGK